MNILKFKKVNKFSKTSTGVPRIVDFGFVFENVSKNLRSLVAKFMSCSVLKSQKSKAFSKPKFTTGFAMLFAVLTASLLLTIGISIFNISFKELTISTNSRESQIAFFAADSARECALYWDSKMGYFPTCVDNKSPDCTQSEVDNKLSLIKCNGAVVYLNKSRSSGSATTTYQNDKFIQYNSLNNLEPESSIFVTKYFNTSDNSIVTTISARGHNVGVLGRRLERSIEQTSVR